MAEHGHRISKTLNTAAVTHWAWLATAPLREGRRGTMDSHSLNSSFGNDSTTTSSIAGDWTPIFAVLTDRDLLLYDSAPWSLDVWAKPTARIPLLMTR